MKAYFDVKPEDDDALRYRLHDMYIKRYDDRNNTFEEQLARRKWLLQTYRNRWIKLGNICKRIVIF